MNSLFHLKMSYITLDNISLPCRILQYPLSEGSLTIYLLHIHSLRLLSDQITDLLPKERVSRTMRFVREPDRLRSLAAGFLIEYIRDQHKAGELMVTDKDKPYFPGGPHFNLSHSGHYVVMAVSDCPVGIDIEQIHPVKDSLINILNTDEKAFVHKHKEPYRAFFHLWTRKESLMKCTGEGIAAIPVGDIPSLAPGEENITSKEETFTFRGVKYRRISTENDEYTLSVTVGGYPGP